MPLLHVAASTQLAGSVFSASAASSVAFPLAAFGFFGSFIAFYRNADAATQPLPLPQPLHLQFYSTLCLCLVMDIATSIARWATAAVAVAVAVANWSATCCKLRIIKSAEKQFSTSTSNWLDLCLDPALTTTRVATTDRRRI